MFKELEPLQLHSVGDFIDLTEEEAKNGKGPFVFKQVIMLYNKKRCLLFAEQCLLNKTNYTNMCEHFQCPTATDILLYPWPPGAVAEVGQSIERHLDPFDVDLIRDKPLNHGERFKSVGCLLTCNGC